MMLSVRPPRMPEPIAGLQVLRIINEPTAAAIAYGLNKKGGEFPRSSSTISVVELSMFPSCPSDDGVFEVMATAGDTHLGGEDFDNRVIEYLVKQYKKKTGTDVTPNLRAMGKLKREVEEGQEDALQPTEYPHRNRKFRRWQRLLGDFD